MGQLQKKQSVKVDNDKSVELTKIRFDYLDENPVMPLKRATYGVIKDTLELFTEYDNFSKGLIGSLEDKAKDAKKEAKKDEKTDGKEDDLLQLIDLMQQNLKSAELMTLPELQQQFEILVKIACKLIDTDNNVFKNFKYKDNQYNNDKIKEFIDSVNDSRNFKDVSKETIEFFESQNKETLINIMLSFREKARISKALN